MTRRTCAAPRSCAAAAAVLLVSIAGCTSSGSAKAAPSTSATKTSVPGTAAAVALAAKMRTGLAGLTSAHVAVDAGSLGGRSTGTFNYSSGKAAASDVFINVGTADRTEILTVASTSYAKLPAGQNTTGKPWAKVSATSKNEFVRALPGTLDLTQAAASLPDVAAIVGTATSVRTRTATAGAAHSYTLQIDPSHTTGTTLGKLLGEFSTSAVPVELGLDASYRPVFVSVSTKLGTQTVTLTVIVGKFNAAVHLAAPPAAQVASI